MTTYNVRIHKDYTVFSSGHFITFDGDQCEPLHGHNYRAACSVEGPLDPNQYVFNFVPLKKILRAACDRLDHRMLLPTDNPLLEVRAEGESFVVRYRHKTYVFPREDVVQLPVPNTTAECLARWLSDLIEVELKALGATHLTALEVEVEESFGQRALCRRSLGSG